MSKKLLIIICSVSLVLLIFFNFFKILRLETPTDNSKIVLVKKVYNPNRLINFLLPKPERTINLGDLVVHKDERYADISFRNLDNKFNRVYGKAGDIVEIHDKVVYTNSETVEVCSSKLYYKYRISFDDHYSCKSIFDSYDIKPVESLARGIVWNVISNPGTIEEFSQKDIVTNVRIDKLERGTNNQGFFPGHMFYAWNKDYMGPIRVPEKGAIVQLNNRNIPTFARIIDRWENNRLRYNLQSITINDIEVDTYNIQKNYCFVVSDNRDMGRDSRNYGFLPYNYITGVVLWN